MDMTGWKRTGLAALLAVAALSFSGGPAIAAEPATVAVTAPATEPAPELTPEDVNAWLDGLVPAALNSSETPGAVVTVVKNGQVVTTRGYGYANVEKRTPMTEDTVVRVASVSKIPTTIAALKLVEQGQLDLDVDINTYVDVPIERSFPESITLRHLLTHTAGFEEYRGDGATYEQGATFDLEKYILSDPPAQVFRPGSTPAYSNYGLNLVGYIVQTVTGVPFEQYLEQTVFAPSGMNSTTYHQPLPEDLVSRLTEGYETTGKAGKGFLTVDPPSGGLSTTAADFAKFMNAQLDGTLLSPELQELAWNAGLPSSYGGQAIGLGYFLGERNGHKTVGHGGDLEYHHSMMELFPEDNIGVFVNVNGDGKEVAGAALRDTLLKEFADRYLPSSGEPAKADDAARGRAEEVAGRYVSARSPQSNFFTVAEDLLPGSIMTIKATEDGGLILAGEQYFRQIAPWVWSDLTDSFTISADPARDNPNLLMVGAMALIPASAMNNFALPGFLTGLFFLIVASLAWPIGALRRKGQLDWLARSARLGALAVLAALAGWATVLLGDPFAVNLTVVRISQVLQFLGALAIIPAVWSFITAVRSRAGWSRYLSSALLVMGLGLVAIVAADHQLFNPDIHF